ncbi:DUF4276 family protein [Myxococcota bacterium]|nr:DUF4276 family protein [Myxococcota bacterium]
MITLVMVVEGQTEEEIAKALLKPHLSGFGVELRKIEIVQTAPGHAGGGSWSKWIKHLRNTSRGWTKPEVRFTTLFDLYGLPRDFPRREEARGIRATSARADFVEAVLGAELCDARWLPYVQRHETEALVLAALPQLRERLGENTQKNGVDSLKRELAGKAPEDVNDGEDTAPSKRLLKHISGYRKVMHGPPALKALGLGPLREVCPRFHAWVSRLEALGTP